MFRIKFLASVTFIIWWALNGLSQEVPTLSYFNITPGNKQVFLSWQLNAGATCLGMSIQRSTDGIAFEEAGKIGGICGDITKPISYSFIDESPPLNTTLFYRLELGKGAFTDTLKTELIDLGGSVVQIRPNPVIDQATIYFTNEGLVEHTLSLHDIRGRIMESTVTRASWFQLKNLHYPPGIYIYTIRSADGLRNYSGKLMIIR